MMIPCIILAILLSYTQINAQHHNERPKLGLALSGGGSLGMAHIGVLKVMEEAGLRPDYITGVSMGSIVGGMYSIGYRADTLYKIFNNLDWNSLLSNNIPENKVVFTEKHNFNNSAMSLPITSRKIMLPSGLINGQQIENLLSFYAWPAARINDFSKLPIPFMCVGTDIITGKIVNLERGYLPDVMRASMAVPSIFTPIRIDTALLTDGGFLRNIAISRLKEMGADIIIGSYTGFHKYNLEELSSMAGILKQLGAMSSINDYNIQKKYADIIIEPDLKDYSSTVFTNADSIIGRGYKAALKYKDYFTRIADSLNKIGYQKSQTQIPGNDSYTFDRIEVGGNEINPDDQILGILNIKPGIRVDKYTLTDKIELLYGKSWFEKVKYRIIPKDDSLILRIECIEKPNAMLFGSVHYDNALESGIILNLSVKNLLTQRSVLDIDSYIGNFYRFRLKSTQFIDRNQSFGFTANFYADKTLIPVLELMGEIGRNNKNDYKAGISIDKSIGLNNMMSLYTNIESNNFIPGYISPSRLKRVSFNYLTAGFIHQSNSIDKKHFPNTGTVSLLLCETSKLFSGNVRSSNYKYVYYEQNPDRFLFKRSITFRGSIKHYHSPGNKLTIAFGADALYTITADSVSSPNNYFYLGGIESLTAKSIPMAGFHPNEIIIDKLAGFGAEFDLELSKTIHLNFITSLALAHEISYKNEYSYFAGYGLGAGYMSIIGPVKVGIMYGMSNNNRYFSDIKGYINIGFFF